MKGSFDKGFYISIPTKMLLLMITLRSYFWSSPFDKDGGALLTQQNTLSVYWEIAIEIHY